MKTEVKNSATTARTSRRSALTIMLRLVGLVRPLAGFMILAILMGVLGNLAATFISIFGAYALLSAMGFASSSPMVLSMLLRIQLTSLILITALSLLFIQSLGR